MKGKKFYYINPSFLGAFTDLIYFNSTKEKITLILDAKEILKKNPLVNINFFILAYEKINNKKFNFFENFINYLFFRIVRYDKKYKNFFVDFSFHNNTKVFEVFKILSKKKIISFGFNEEIKDRIISDLTKKEILLFHCRDESYKKKVFETDLSYHDYRNEDLRIYENALNKVNKKKNYSTVRFGSIGEKKCQKENGIFDYTFSKFRNQFNDIHLMKNCKIYIGTGSGPDTLALNFQKPIVFINWIHLPNLFTFQNNIVAIFKKIYDKKEKKFLKFKDLLNLNFKLNKEKTPVGLYYRSQQYQLNNLEVINNSEDEIYNAVKEMLNYLDGRFNFDIKVQDKFREQYHKYNKNEISDKFFISEYFIKKNLDLFN